MTRKASGLPAMRTLAGAAMLVAAAFVAECAGSPRLGARTRPSGTRGPAPVTAPASRPAPDPNATEPGPWTDANVGTMKRARCDGNMIQTTEIVRAEEASVTFRTTLDVPGVKPTEQVVARRLTPNELRMYWQSHGRKTGQETLRVGEEDLVCDVYEREMAFGQRKVVTRIWVCKSVPGWSVRVDSDARGTMTTTYLVTEFRR